MDLPQYITAEFDKLCTHKFGVNPALESFFKNHERRPLLEKNLLKEIREIELTGKIVLSREKIEWIVQDFCHQFFKYSLMAAEKAALSEAETQRRLHEETEFNEIQQIIEENSNDRIEYLPEK